MDISGQFCFLHFPLNIDEYDVVLLIKAMVHEILGIKNNKVQLRHSLNDEKARPCISPASARAHPSSVLKHLEV